MKVKQKTSIPTYTKKGFPAVLDQFFAKNCPQLGGYLTREVIVKEVIKLFEDFYPPTERMKMGQILWYAVDVDEKAGYGKKIEDCKVKPVILDLLHHSDIDDLLKGIPKRERQKKITARLFFQAHKKKAVLTNADAGAIMRLAPGTISKYIREYEKEKGEMVPRRGNIHDMGRTLTHKKQICIKHLKEGKTIEQTAKETYHSPQAVVRYISDFKRVRECLKEGWEVEKISYTTGMSKELTKEYVNMIQEKQLPI